MAVAEINTYLILVFFFGNDATIGTLKNCGELAYQLLNNPYLQSEEENVSNLSTATHEHDHIICALPAHKIFCGAEMVESKSKYPERTCIICKKRCRTYCACSPGVHRCKQCFVVHVVDAKNQKES